MPLFMDEHKKVDGLTAEAVVGATIVTLTMAALFILPRLQVTVPLAWLHVP
jgi:hypothetical protein